ncbi:LysR family transcriptional regulator [Aestuariibius sp. 2305UL40-4]|uniref:LysR family transcriptional regulator n=1 Tax=Aestuariibius violaceus TaxID=3234132 RepID=UPI00345ED5BB
MARPNGEAILFELLRSFTTLAETLNLTRTVEQLGTTRQTVRRHMSILEEHMGGPLFELNEREYRLTTLGRSALREAQELLARGEAWLANQSSHVGGLFHLKSRQVPQVTYYLQQHPLRQVWTADAPLLQESIRSWALAGGALEHPAFQRIRPFAMVFRLHGESWLCTEVGPKSSFATWFGWEWQRSMIGRELTDLPGGTSFATLLAQPMRDVYETEGIRLDHVFTEITRVDGEAPEPVAYRRLLLGCRFPDGSFALVSIVDRTYNVVIDGVDQTEIERMSPDLLMSPDPNDVID